MILAANGAVKKKGSYYKAKYSKLTLRTGSKNKAKVAIANRIARSIYCLLSDPKINFKDLGSHYVIDEKKQVQYHLEKLKKLGIDINIVTVEKIEAVVNI